VKPALAPYDCGSIDRPSQLSTADMDAVCVVRIAVLRAAQSSAGNAINNSVPHDPLFVSISGAVSAVHVMLTTETKGELKDVRTIRDSRDETIRTRCPDSRGAFGLARPDGQYVPLAVQEPPAVRIGLPAAFVRVPGDSVRI